MPPDPTSQRGDDDPSELSPKWVSDLQGLLPQRGMPPLTVGVSRPSELQPLRRTDARDPAGTVCLSLHAIRSCDGVSFMDSTRLPVCENRRIPRHRVCVEQADRGKTSLGWFYGFKLHLLINTQGDLLGAELTPGNIDDRVPVEKLTQSVFGKLYADKGYISKELRQTLKTQDVDLIYKVRKNMKPQPLSTYDEVMLKKRMLIETVIGQLKSQTQLQHTRHRSFVNFQVNSVSALIAYTYLEKKPTLKLRVIDESNDEFPVPKNP